MSSLFNYKMNNVLRGDAIYQDPNFLDDLLAHLREGGRRKVEAVQKTVRATSYRESVYFVHGLRENPPTSALRANNGIGDSLSVLLTVQPAICVSSVADNAGLWSGAGVILQDGDIVYANGDTDKETRNKLTKEDVTLEQIARLCKNRTGIGEFYGGYNEFVVKNPVVAGLYLLLERRDDAILFDTHYQTQNYRTYAELAQSWDLPFYGLLDGELYVFNILENGNIQLEKKLAREEVIERKIFLLEERFIKEKERVLTNGLLVGDEEAYDMFCYWKKGRDLFSDLYEVENIDDAELQVGSILEETARKYRVGESNGKFKGLVDGDTCLEMPYGYVELNIGSACFGLYRDVASPTQCLEVLEVIVDNIEAISTLIEEQRERLRWVGYQAAYKINDGDDHTHYLVVAPYGLSEGGLLHIGASLYGFAEEARKKGRDDLSGRAEALAGRLFPKQEMDSLLEKRLSSKGGFRTYIKEVVFAA
jgi:hypothetical protein